MGKRGPQKMRAEEKKVVLNSTVDRAVKHALEARAYAEERPVSQVLNRILRTALGVERQA